jgi:hypothetical protein
MCQDNNLVTGWKCEDFLSKNSRQFVFCNEGAEPVLKLQGWPVNNMAMMALIKRILQLPRFCLFTQGSETESMTIAKR